MQHEKIGPGEQRPPFPAEPDEEAARPGPREQVEILVEDAKRLASAERDYWLARLLYARGQAKYLLLLFGLAIATGTGAVLAFIFGLLMVLNPVIGPLLSTLTVTFVFSAIAALFYYLGLRRARRLSFVPDSEEEEE